MKNIKKISFASKYFITAFVKWFSVVIIFSVIIIMPIILFSILTK
tara:strand:- start:624 stop:758 length:135 start_codon:yes stop_codon:yes gene_type:complete